MTKVALRVSFRYMCSHKFSQFHMKNKVFFSFVKIWNKTYFCNRITGHFLSSSSFEHFIHLYGSVQDWDKTTSSWQHFFASILFHACSTSQGGDTIKMKDNSSDSSERQNIRSYFHPTQKTVQWDFLKATSRPLLQLAM